MIPDCFRLDVPLTGFNPPQEIQSPVNEIPSLDFNESDNVINSEATPTCNNVTSFEATPTHNNDTTTVSATPTCNDESSNDETESPNTTRKRTSNFGRDTLDNAWTSRSKNPLRYALGVVNTVTDLVDNHVHFSSQKSHDETTPTESNVNEPVGCTIPTPPSLSDITCQDPDMSRYVNKKWEGPKPPETPMDHLISMGFANRDLNSRLLKKHKNNMQQALQELLDTNGDGYQTV